MIENISKKQKKIQEKVQKQQDLNDKDCELTDEELEQIVGGAYKPGPGPVLAEIATMLGTTVTLKVATVDNAKDALEAHVR